MPTAPGSGISRRRALAGLLLIPPAVSGCALGRPGSPRPVDPLLALADAARADAALATAAIALDLPVDRVGLVASVAASCAGYATVLT